MACIYHLQSSNRRLISQPCVATELKKKEKTFLLCVYCAGACWSFSATGAVEGINQIKTGSLVSVSEQELIDCDKSYNDGCGGGLMDYAYEFIIKNKGIDTEDDYPYQARDKTCDKKKVILFFTCTVVQLLVFAVLLRILLIFRGNN